MAKDIAKTLDVKLEYTESTYGNSVLELQSGKIDLAFALSQTPQRALSTAKRRTRPGFQGRWWIAARQTSVDRRPWQAKRCCAASDDATSDGLSADLTYRNSWSPGQRIAWDHRSVRRRTTRCNPGRRRHSDSSSR